MLNKNQKKYWKMIDWLDIVQFLHHPNKIKTKLVPKKSATRINKKERKKERKRTNSTSTSAAALLFRF